MEKSKRCPLCFGKELKLRRTIKSDTLIETYKNLLQVDVNKYFNKVEKIEILECVECSYMFYYPFSIFGDESFYEQLCDREGYYLESRWEFDTALEFIKEGDKVLEVGCGSGNFLRKAVDKKNVVAKGIELNQKAISIAKYKGLDVEESTIENFVSNSKNKYDCVCAFQVLEHIVNVNEFIKNCCSLLNPNGKLIFAVPNNNAFMYNRMEIKNILNFPPHHSGLWTEQSLRSVAKIMGLKLVDIRYEKLQEYQYNWYLMTLYERNYLLRLILKVVFKLKLEKVMYFILKYFSKYINGHTIIAVYEK